MLCLQKTLWSNQITIRQFAMCWLCNHSPILVDVVSDYVNTNRLETGFKSAPAKRSFRRSQASSVALTRSGIRSITHQLLCKPTLQSPASSSSFTWTWEAHRRTGHWEMRSPSAPGPTFSFFIMWSMLFERRAAPKCSKMKKGICENCVVLSHADQQLPNNKKSKQGEPLRS